jgi:hypothetical protein
MKHLQTILAVILVLTSSAKSDETKEPRVDLPAKYASELPECDRIEVFLLDGGVQNEGGDGTFPIRPYKQFSNIEKKKEIKGEEAKKLCNTWRSLTFDMWSQAMCHFPIYGLRFYQGDKLQFETSVCFGCSNFYFSRDGGGTSWHGFRKNDDAGKTLIASLNEIIPRPEKPKEREQGGTGLPSTRSQSTSESSDKPQPEAEGRSR